MVAVDLFVREVIHIHLGFFIIDPRALGRGIDDCHPGVHPMRMGKQDLQDLFGFFEIAWFADDRFMADIHQGVGADHDPLAATGGDIARFQQGISLHKGRAGGLDLGDLMNAAGLDGEFHAAATEQFLALDRGRGENNSFHYKDTELEYRNTKQILNPK